MQENSSVLTGRRTCPRCLYEEAFYEIKASTGEECMICQKCGLVRQVEAVIDERLQIQNPEGEPCYERREDGSLIYELLEYRAFGAFGLFKEGSGQQVPLSSLFSEEEMQRFAQELESGCYGYLNYWDESTRSVTTVLGDFESYTPRVSIKGKGKGGQRAKGYFCVLS